MEKIIKDAANKLLGDYDYKRYDITGTNIILSGGALVSTVYNMYHNLPTECQHNDIDIYIQRGVSNEDKANLQTYMTLYSVENEVLDNIYSQKQGIYNLIVSDFILLTKTYKEGGSLGKALIKTFDLNCCMVAYDILNDEVHYNDEFIDFIKNNRIYMVSKSNGDYIKRFVRYIYYCDKFNISVDKNIIDAYSYSLKYYDRHMGIHKSYVNKFTRSLRENNITVEQREDIYFLNFSNIVNKENILYPVGINNYIKIPYNSVYKEILQNQITSYTYNNYYILAKFLNNYNLYHFTFDILHLFKEVLLNDEFFNIEWTKENIYKINYICGFIGGISLRYLPKGFTILDLVNMCEILMDLSPSYKYSLSDKITNEIIDTYIEHKDMFNVLMYNKLIISK